MKKFKPATFYWFVFDNLILSIMLTFAQNSGWDSFVFSLLRQIKASLAFIIAILIILGVMSLIVWLFSIIMHIVRWRNTRLQLGYIVLLTIIPVYVITAMVTLFLPQFAEAAELIRKMYESFSLFVFGSLIVYFVGGWDHCIRYLETHRARHYCGPCIPAFHPRSKTLWFTTVLVAQFVILVPILALITLILIYFNLYEEGVISWTSGFIFIKPLIGISGWAALFGLIILYRLTRKMTQEYSPFYKFLAIKLVFITSIM
jgi:hypothetical protein